MDQTQLEHFLKLLLGWRTIGVAQDEEVCVPTSDAMQSFLYGMLGDQMPRSEHHALTVGGRRQALALASLLREAGELLETRHVVGQKD